MDNFDDFEKAIDLSLPKDTDDLHAVITQIVRREVVSILREYHNAFSSDQSTHA